MRSILIFLPLFYISTVAFSQDTWMNNNKVKLTDSGKIVTASGDTLGPEITKVVAAPTTSGTMSIDMSRVSVVTITPSGSCTFNAVGGVAGRRVTFLILTSGTIARTITWGTNFKKAGTLSTGTINGRYFSVSFICIDGTLWVETGRTGTLR